MSELIVEVRVVEEKRPHPNADRLEFIRLGGWWVIVQKELLEVGQSCVYIPPESVLTEEYAEKLGITKYCSPVRVDGVVTGYRVKAARLRGEASYGTIDSDVRPEWVVGQDVREILGIWKWEPPLRCLDGDAAAPRSAFHKYTSIENIRNYPNEILDGEQVCISEKLHGMNSRVGYILDADDEGNAAHVFMAGSHEVRRKEIDASGNRSAFWVPLENENLRNLLRELSNDESNVVVFGELINTQKGFNYGCGSQVGFRVFDITVNMKYLDFDVVQDICNKHSIAMVPILYQGPFSWAKIEELVDGPTEMCPADKAGSFKGREGIVVKPIKERVSVNYPGDKRIIFKAISVDYSAYRDKKGAEEVDASDA